METDSAKQIISDSKNIYIIPSEEPGAIASSLALFYSLKNLGKNVNLILEALPENLKFLSPSLDFISYPKNFVISVPNKTAGISQVYYEKNDEAVKIHLTLENGNINKDDVSFYFSEAKPDLVITAGVKDYAAQLSGKLNNFGFLLDSPILNIDTLTNPVQENKKFGKINLIEESSLAEIIFNLTESASKESTNCLLAGLIIYTDNFKNKITAEIFGIASVLMKKGANLEEIVKNIYNK